MTIIRSKETRNIVLLGNTGYGKSTILSAISHIYSSKLLAEKRAYEDIANGAVELNMNGVQVNGLEFRLESQKFNYVFLECATHQDVMKLLGAETLWPFGAVLVVSGPDGLDVENEDSPVVVEAKKTAELGLKTVAFINKLDLMDDDDEDAVELVETEVGVALNPNDKEDVEIVTIIGSALKDATTEKPQSSIEELVTELDRL